jgi:hypothetical protein
LLRAPDGYRWVERTFDKEEIVAEDEVQRNPERPTDEWVTGDEPMTGPQQSYLHTLANEAGEQPPGELTKAQASEEIERLQRATNRG